MKRTRLLMVVWGMITLVSMSVARAAVLRVDPDDPNAYATIKKALDVVVAGDTVLLAPGLHQSDTSGTTFWVDKPVVIRGEGGAGQCVIQADAFHIDESVLEVTFAGLTIRQSQSYEGGAIYSESAGQMHVVDCNFEENTASKGDGGAIYLLRGQAHIYNCMFSQNSASDDGGAIACNESATLLMEDCVFMDNHSDDNGGALFCRDTQVTLRRCRFFGNQSDSNGGAGYIRDSLWHAHFLNCLFDGNHGSDDGGALYVRDSSAIVVHCTVVGNSADGEAGGLASNGGHRYTVYGSILWANVDSEGQNATAQLNESNAMVTYSCIQNWETQDSILTQDPLFVDADGQDNVSGTADDDLHLQVGSPCVDASLFTEVSWPFELDLERQGRLVGTTVDLGALEVGAGPGDETLYTSTVVEPVLISEVYTHSPDSNDWIELYNATDQPVNIGGWVLNDGPYSPFDPVVGPVGNFFVFEPNVMILPGEYLVLTEGREIPFALNASGERLTLVSGVEGISTGYLETHYFDYAQEGESLIRHINSMGLLEFVPSVVPTPGSDNAAPKVGPIVVSEINYDRDEEPYQYIELLNTGSESITVFRLSSESYAIEGSVSYYHQKVNDVVLEPGERVIIANYPDLLSSSTSAQVVGPLEGDLPQQGGIVTLMCPGRRAMAEEVVYNVGLGLYEDEWKSFWFGENTSDHGRSLERIDPNAYANDAANWQLAWPTMGYGE